MVPVPVVAEHERGVVSRTPRRVRAEPVREVHQAPEVPEPALVDHPVDVVEHRPEVGAPAALQLEPVHQPAQVALAGDDVVRAHHVVALDDMEVGPAAGVGLPEDVECLLEEPDHGPPHGGAGGVYGDDELLHPAGVRLLQGVDQRHVPVDGQPVGVVDGVELGLALPDYGAAGHELAQERAVVVSPAVAYPEDRHQRTGPPFVVPDEALHLGHDLLGELPPDGVVKGPAAGVVVPDEHLPVGLQLPGGRVPHNLGQQVRRRRARLGELPLAGEHPVIPAGDGRVRCVQAVEDVLHEHVLRQIGLGRVAGRPVAEDAVKDAVGKVAGDGVGLVPER